MRARLSGDGGAFSVELVDGVFRVTAEDPGDAGIASAAESQVATAIRFDYSPSQGTATAFAAMVASDFLKAEIVKPPPPVGELEQAEASGGSRAFCPGASPPDNSCSPNNKGDGKLGGTKSGKTPKTPKKSPAEKQMDMMREYMERFDGSSLARPRVIMGMPDFHVNPVEFSKYLESQGQEWQGAALPKFVQRGKMGDCYENATRLVLHNPELDYVEGVAYPSGMSGMGFLHGWAVDRRTGRVIDNTWDKPEDCKYFGVRYERKEYMRHVARTKYYGVVGGDPKVAARVIKKGKL